MEDLVRHHSMNKHIKFNCIESNTMNDFTFLPYNGLSFCTIDIPRKHMYENDHITHSLLVAGQYNAMSIYTIGGILKFQHLGKLAEYVKDSLETAVSSTIMSLFGNRNKPKIFKNKSINNNNNKNTKSNNISSSSSSSSNNKNGPHSHTNHATTAATDCDDDECDQPPPEPIEQRSLTSQLDFEDSKRRILRVSLDPQCGRLVATADGLGRVCLYDTRLNAMVRMWKGFRDAQLAWSEELCIVPDTATTAIDATAGTTVVDDNTTSFTSSSSIYDAGTTTDSTTDSTDNTAASYRYGLVLAIYAPQLGLLFMYGMKHGPLLRTVPVGQHAHILTMPPTSYSHSVSGSGSSDDNSSTSR